MKNLGCGNGHYIKSSTLQKISTINVLFLQFILKNVGKDITLGDTWCTLLDG